MIANGIKGILHAVPPRQGYGTDIRDKNDGIAALAAANPTVLKFTNDSVDLADSNYAYDSTCFYDGVHPNQKGQYLTGVRMQPDLTNWFAPNDPRITDSNDTYYINSSSDQYVKNPFNSGTGGGLGGGCTGVVPTFWSVSNSGAGTTSVVSIISADAEDTNSTPWMRVTVTGLGGSGHLLNIITTLGHPALAADLFTVKRLDMMCEVRFNIDTTNLDKLCMYALQGSTRVGTEFYMGLKGNGVINKTALLRSSFPRNQDGAAVVAHAANSVGLRFEISTIAAQASTLGTIDFRLASVRGQAT